MNATFYHGTCIEKNHYTSSVQVCRGGTFITWIEIDNAQATKKQ